MADVWAGHHELGLGRVAIKVLRRDDEDVARFADALRNEAHAHARLDHPNIVRLFDYGEADDALVARGLSPRSPYLITELATGGTLVGLGFPVPLEQHAQLLLAMLAGLAHAHARGVVHRDLKPSNVLLDANGRPQLCDFGIASALRASIGEHVRAGTPRFMAPEQVVDRAWDEGPHTDLYAVGCLAYVLACGRAPFDGDPEAVQVRHVLASPPPPPVPLPAAYADWIATLLAKDPASRFPTAAHAARALLDVDFAGPTQRSAPPSRSHAHDSSFRGPRPSRWPPPPLPTTHETGLTPGWLGHASRSTLPSFAGLGLFGLRTVPLAARDAEKDALFRALGDVIASSRPRVVLLTGTAGVGKTRLAEWLLERVGELGVAMPISARFSRAHAPTEGFGPLLARLMRVPPTSDPRPRIATWLEETGLPSAIDAEDLAALVSGRPGRFTRPELRHAAIRRAIARVAERTPVVLHLDDAPLSGDAMAFVESVCASSEPLALLVVLTARDGDVDARTRSLAKGPVGMELRVEPLTPEGQAAFVEDLLGLDPLLALDVARRTAGNPLFAVQIVRDWVTRRALVAGERGFVLRGDVDARIPDDVHTHFRAQIERAVARAAPDAASRARIRMSLEIGALLGASPDLDEWSATTEAEGTAPARAAAAVLSSAGLGTLTATRFAFSHELIRESLERTATEGARADRHHVAIATALTGSDPERVATHLLLAREHERAIAPALEATARRLWAGDFAAVHAWAERVHGALDGIGASTTDRRHAHADVYAVEALLSAGSLDRAGELVVEVEERAGDDRRLLSRAAWLRGIGWQKRGEVREALRHFERAAALTDEHEDPLGMARARYGCGECLKILGDLRGARRVYEQSARLFAIAGENEGRVLSALADLAIREGDVERAIGLGRRAFDVFSAAGMRYQVAIAANLLGDLERRRGDTVRARAHYASAMQMMESFTSHESWIVQINVALLDVDAGDFARAEESLLTVESELSRRGAEAYAHVARCVRLPCLAARGAFHTLDAVLDEVTPALDALVDPDVLAMLRRAQAIAFAADETARAARLGGLADAQRAALERR
jgi:tetratricopeptide (TPR) repeat protein